MHWHRQVHSDSCTAAKVRRGKGEALLAMAAVTPGDERKRALDDETSGQLVRGDVARQLLSGGVLSLEVVDEKTLELPEVEAQALLPSQWLVHDVPPH